MIRIINGRPRWIRRREPRWWWTFNVYYLENGNITLMHGNPFWFKYPQRVKIAWKTLIHGPYEGG